MSATTGSLLRPYMRGAVNPVPARGAWPRSFAVSWTGPDAARWRAEFTIHTEATALFTLERTVRDGLVDPPLVGWCSWQEGEVVAAWRNMTTGAQAGGLLAGYAPADDGPLDGRALDTDRWLRLAKELRSAASEAQTL